MTERLLDIEITSLVDLVATTINTTCGTEHAALRITSLRDNNKNMSQERVISSNLQSTVERVYQRQPSLYNTEREEKNQTRYSTFLTNYIRTYTLRQNTLLILLLFVI